MFEVRRYSSFVCGALCVLLVLSLSGLFMLTAPPQAAQASGWSGHIGLGTPAKVNQLMYPTIGNPAMIKTGETFIIEFDPRNRNFSGSCPDASNFVVTAKSSNDDATYQVTRNLPIASFVKGLSIQWPEYQTPPSPSHDWNIYRVTVNVPGNIPHDLYDVTVACQVDGSPMTDTQPNALQTVDQFKDHFSFVQLSDIHVYGPENPDSWPFYSQSQLERGARHTNYNEQTDGYGATYLHKLIMEINRMKPDFCVFTGDYDFGQRYFTQNQGSPWGTTTQYEYEQLWFYSEMKKLDVPVYITIGNHDGYAESTAQGAGSNDDWLENFRRLYGPLYHSWDYGEYHFISTNSMDWASSLRKLTDYLNLILQPTKYLGQFQGFGDVWNEGGVTTGQLDAINVNSFAGQLKWIRDDLAAHQTSKMRILSMHHDPWKDEGSGSMWASGGSGWLEQITGAIDMGDGEGRLAIMRLMRDYGVAMEISGHDHSDYYRTVDWASYGGSGQSIMCNTTSASFQAKDGTASTEYPGYRRVWINDGALESSGYYNNLSYPTYNNTNVEGGSRDQTTLTTPAIEWGALTGTSDSQDRSCTIQNHFSASPPAISSQDFIVEFPMPYASGGKYYTASNGTITEVADNTEASPTKRTCFVNTDVAPGGSRTPRVTISVGSDASAPTGSVSINNGDAQTPTVNVTLTIAANDTGGAGVKDMMISNYSDFSGAVWEPYTTTKSWTLLAGAAGTRTVYIKFRDAAMPPNPSGSYSDTITYTQQEPQEGPRIVSCDPSVARRGDVINVTVTGEDTNFVPLQSQADFGPGVSAQSPTVEGTGQATVPVMVDTEAAIGARTVNVTTRQETPNPLVNGFRVINFTPIVSVVEPDWGYVGDEVTVYGSYFNDTQGSSSIQFGGVPATQVLSWSDTVIRCKVPQGASSGPVTVNTESGPSNDNLSFTIIQVGPTSPPAIIAIDPTSGGAGSEVSITGLNFGSAPAETSYVEFNGARAGVNWWSDTSITCRVPSAATSGPVTVTTQYGTSNGASFQVTGDAPPVPTEPSQVWYLAEGSTADGFETFILVQNPNAEAAHVKVTYMTATSQVAGPEIDVAAKSRQTFNIFDSAPNEMSVSTMVEADKPVIAERSMYWAERSAGHDSTGVTMASKTWYLAEGTTASGYETWILVQNPGDTDANVGVFYQTPAGEVEGPKLLLKPHTRQSVNVGNTVPDTYDVSTRVASDEDVIAERSVYWYGRMGGTESIGVTNPSKQWFMAEGSTSGGFETWVLIQNPLDHDATAKLTFMTDSGFKEGPSVLVKAHSRQSVNVANCVPETANVSTRITSDEPVIAERSMYWGNRIEGHDSVGVIAPAATWYLAEGSTAAGFETWVLVQNPSDQAANVTLTFMTPSGEKPGPTVPLAGNSRVSFNVGDLLPGEYSVSTKVTADRGIIVERSMYWNERTGGHESVGVPE